MTEEEKHLTPQERYRINHRDKLNEYTRNYFKNRYNNNEEYRKRKQEANLKHYYKRKIEGKGFKEYQDKFKENHPEYYKEYFKEYNPKYYEENKERILKMVGEKVLCECCNKEIRKDYMCKHIFTKKHKQNSIKS